MKYGSLIFSFLSFIPLVFSFDIFNFFSQCGNDYDFHYKTPHKYLSMSEYIDSLNSNRFIQTFIEELILDGTVNDLGELIRSFTEYIVLIGFGVIFLISWPVFGVCWCTKCGLYKEKRKESLSNFICYCVSVIMLWVMFLVGIIGIAKTKRIDYYYDGATFTLGNPLNHSLSGEGFYDDSNWIGVMHMKQITKQLREIPSNINKNYNELFNEDKMNQFNEAYAGFNSIFNAIVNRYKENSNTFSNSYVPDYSKEFNNISNYDTFIGKIYRDYFDNIEENKALYESIREYASYSQEDIHYLTNREKELNDELFYFGDVLHRIFCKYSMNFALIKSYSQEYINLIYKLLFSFYIIIPFSIIILFTLELWIGINQIKYAIHVLWNILFLFLFIGCVIAGVSGIISKIAVNLTPILERWTSVDFLGIGESDLGGTENSAIYVDTCVSGNGDLSIPLGIIEDRIVKINQYVNNAQLLLEVHNDRNDIERVNGVVTQIKDVEEDNVYELSINKTIKDMKNEINSNSIDCSTTTSSIYQSYCAFINDVHNDIITLESNADELNEKYRIMKTLITDMIDNANEINQRIIKEYQSLKGNNNNIFKLFDCSFMKPDLLSFAYLFGNKFAGINYSVCLCSFIGAVCGYIGIYFLIYTMYHYQINTKEEHLVIITQKPPTIE